MEIGTNITIAAKRLQTGKLVAIPTETVYGLAGNAYDDDAVKHIYQTKKRPKHNPLIVHVLNKEQAKSLVIWNDDAEQLSNAFWPGPLTMVLKRLPDCPISPLASAGLDTLAIRVPAYPIARELLAACHFPLAAPSANISGRVTSTNAEHVASDFANQDIYILEAGQTPIGLESTVLQLTDDAAYLLRPGSITKQQLEHALNRSINHLENPSKPTSPGMLKSHYAPNAKLRLNATKVEEGEALLAFGPPLHSPSSQVVNLSEQGDLTEASANLFAALRKLDSMQPSAIAVMPIPNESIGEAINDRLKRAAAPKQS